MNQALYLLLLFDGDGEAAATPATMIGQWSRVTYLQASAPRIELTAKHTTATMEATDANNH